MVASTAREYSNFRGERLGRRKSLPRQALFRGYRRNPGGQGVALNLRHPRCSRPSSLSAPPAKLKSKQSRLLFFLEVLGTGNAASIARNDSLHGACGCQRRRRWLLLLSRPGILSTRDAPLRVRSTRSQAEEHAPRKQWANHCRFSYLAGNYLLHFSASLRPRTRGGLRSSTCTRFILSHAKSSAQPTGAGARLGRGGHQGTAREDASPPTRANAR